MILDSSHYEVLNQSLNKSVPFVLVSFPFSLWREEAVPRILPASISNRSPPVLELANKHTCGLYILTLDLVLTMCLVTDDSCS